MADAGVSKTIDSDAPLGELELLSRTYYLLKRQRISTVGQLTEWTEADLLDIRNFGSKSLNDVKEKLQGVGRSLKS